MDCNGLVFVDGRIEVPICNRTLRVTGSLFTDDGMRYIVPDYSGNNYDGIVNGNCTWVAGRINGAINLDGDGDFIDIGNPSELNITDKITVTAWIKVNAFDKAYQAIVTKGDTSWQLRRNGTTNNVQFAVRTAAGDPISVTGSSVNVNDGLWHHIAGVYDKGSDALLLYVDGVLVGTGEASGDLNTNSASVYIGENAEQRGKYFNGLIDDVRVYHKGLSLLEILDIFGGITLTGELKGHWTMDSGNCSTVVNVAPTKAAIYHWPSGSKDRWSPVGGAFYKSITRNP